MTAVPSGHAAKSRTALGGTGIINNERSSIQICQNSLTGRISTTG
jgi:hypothetical protein